MISAIGRDHLGKCIWRVGWALHFLTFNLLLHQAFEVNPLQLIFSYGFRNNRQEEWCTKKFNTKSYLPRKASIA